MRNFFMGRVHAVLTRYTYVVKDKIYRDKQQFQQIMCIIGLFMI